MKIEFNQLFTHFIFTTQDRQPLIEEKNRKRIEKFINKNNLAVSKFSWQKTATAFSVSNYFKVIQRSGIT